MARETPAQWTVEEVLPETAKVEGDCLDGVARLVRISRSGSYTADHPWPEVGQKLVVAES